jgi:hypothetical protein
MRAALLLRRRNVEDEGALGNVLDELATVEAELFAMPEDAAARPMLGLARRLGWSDEETGFLWAVVALHVHPRMMVHAHGMDEAAPRGMTVSLYSRIADLEGEAACALGLQILPGHSAVRNGLLLPARGEWGAAAQPRSS